MTQFRDLSSCSGS